MKRVVIATQIALACMVMTTQAHAATPLQTKAVEALKQAHDEPNGSVYEHGGMLVMNNGALRFFEPYPDNTQIDGVRAYDKTMLLAGDVMVGTYHTHPCMKDYYNAYFSIPDVIVAIFTKVPAFMLDECTGDVHEFFSETDSVHETGADVTIHHICTGVTKVVHLPAGRIVGNIGEIDPVRVVENEVECP